MPRVVIDNADRGRVLKALDEGAREWMGVSGEDFLTILKGGGYDGWDTPAIERLVAIARLLD